MSQDNNEAKSPESWPPGSSERVAHSIGLYERARELLCKQPLSFETAKLAIAMAEDALAGLGATNQQLKVKLGAIIEEARDALPPANFDELKKRGEGKFIEKIYRPGIVARNVLSAGGVLLAVLIVAFPIVSSFSGRDETAEAVPTRVELTPTPLPTRPAPPEVIFTPTPAPATPEPTPTPTPTATPQPSPTPTVEKSPIVNATPMWGRLLTYIEWRVAAIQPLGPKGTRFIFEIRNTDESTEWDCYSFDRAPLIVVEKGTGRMFPMIGMTHLPSDIQERNGKWYIQASRTIRAAVDFGVVTNGSFAGKVEYKDQNRAVPAQFLYAP
jgi:hypothetical protein